MTPRQHLVIGAGPVGTALALRLATTGDTVRVGTRSGSGPGHPLVQRMALDAADLDALSRAATGVDVLYNCANPGSYPKWESVWPPLAASILHAAEASGAVLVTLGNLYGYGPVDGPMTRDLPLRPSDHKGALRAQMWQDALAAHEAGRIRATEARASDYLGPTATPAAGLLAMYAARTLVGRTAAVFGDPDQPHTWTAVDDIAATLATLGADERAWGSPWLVPSNPPATVRDVLRELGRHAGTGEPRLRRVPRWVLSAGGVAMPLLREVTGVLYQFERPFVVDASATTTTFGLEPMPWDALLRDLDGGVEQHVVEHVDRLARVRTSGPSAGVARSAVFRTVIAGVGGGATVGRVARPIGTQRQASKRSSAVHACSTPALPVAPPGQTATKGVPVS